MIRSVTGLCSRGDFALAGIAAAICATATPAAARAVTDQTVTARDVAMTPIEDLNLSRDPIPAVLIKAAEGPYHNPGLSKCSKIRTEIADLDAVLGEDFDTAKQEQRKLTAGRVALGLVGGLIPYRGVIRQLSGAANHEYEFKQAISAGLMRRAYLKGLGEARKCEYPARPMPPEMAAEMALRNSAPAEESEQTDGSPVVVSQAVVQTLPKK